ncbi:MAG: epoxyqueuosine reductase [Spirochaetes bacterium]|nr:epoxyqueuosine reductase [Spirochaetota bacterium]
MKKNLMSDIERYIKSRDIPVFAAADAERLNQTAPEGFRPMDYLPGAKSVLLLAKPLPVSVFSSANDPGYSFYIRAFTSYYNLMNESANQISVMLESEGFASLPVPSYSPLTFYRGEPRGLISFKHAAEAAGLGRIGKNTLFIHPEYGNVLRFGGVLTTMKWPAVRSGQAGAGKSCPEGCTLCIQACPVGALKGGTIDKTACMTRCIKHVMMPPRFMMRFLGAVMRKSTKLTRFMELFTLNFFEEYGIRCVNCLTACPHFPGRKLNASASRLGDAS